LQPICHHPGRFGEDQLGGVGDMRSKNKIQNSLARAVVKAPKSTHITLILKSLRWLKVNERIEYKTSLSLLLTKFVQLLNLAIFATLSLFNL